MLRCSFRAVTRGSSKLNLTACGVAAAPRRFCATASEQTAIPASAESDDSHSSSFLDSLSPSERRLVALKRRSREAGKLEREQAMRFAERLRQGKCFDPPPASSSSSSDSATSSPYNEDHPLVPMVMDRVLDASLPPLRLFGIFHSLTTPHHMLPDHAAHNRRACRLAQVSKMCRFLLDHNVLLHAVVRFHPRSRTWNVTPSYPRLVTLGQSRIATEAGLRVSKVFPNATLAQMQALEDAVLDPRLLASLFDTVGFNRLVHPRDARQLHPLSANQKATLLCAMLAELKWFVDRTRPTNRTHNNALFPPSDVLILHSLAAHSVECLTGELLWHLLEPIVERVARRWRNFDTCLVEQLDLPASAAQLNNASGAATAASVEEQRRKSLVAQKSRFGVAVANTSQLDGGLLKKRGGAGDDGSSVSHFKDSATSQRWKTARLEPAPRRRTITELVNTRDGYGNLIERAACTPLQLDKQPRSDFFFSPTNPVMQWDKLRAAVAPDSVVVESDGLLRQQQEDA